MPIFLSFNPIPDIRLALFFCPEHQVRRTSRVKIPLLFSVNGTWYQDVIVAIDVAFEADKE